MRICRTGDAFIRSGRAMLGSASISMVFLRAKMRARGETKLKFA